MESERSGKSFEIKKPSTPNDIQYTLGMKIA
jgi:hypothetical protein